MSIAPGTILNKSGFGLEGAVEFDAASAWYGGRPMTTQLLNAYGALIPDGERFIIRTCRRFSGHAGPALAHELQVLFHQEGRHAVEHGRALASMRGAGIDLQGFARLVARLSYRVLEPLSPARLRLATAAAIEHHNAAIAAFFLSRGLLREARATDLRQLYLWHFAEEIEHKETVFKLLQSVSRSWLLRAAGLAISGATFLQFLACGTLLLAARSGAAARLDFWRECARQLLGRDGLGRALAGASLRYLAPGFHPRDQDHRALLESALAELAKSGSPRVDAVGAVAARALPPAFAARVLPAVERINALEPRYDFFYSPIAGYAGARVLCRGQAKLNFCTYSYLGLLRHPRVQRAAQAAIRRYGSGTHGVRLLGGNLQIHQALEARIAGFLGRQAALVLSSGYMTNLAVISTLVGRGDFVFCDRLNHASIVDGCRLSGASVVRFRHNDVTGLAQQLAIAPAGARKLIVVDAVYSMDGDIAPLGALLDLRDRHPNTLLMVDEAHSLGVLGAHGRGIEEHCDRRGAVDILMGCLSKSLPAQGGYVAGSSEIIKFLRYNARGFVFSAALAPASAAAALAGLELIESEGAARRARLMANVDYFVGRLRRAGFAVGGGATPIVPLLLASETLAFEMARHCNLEGLFAMPVVQPAVPAGSERLRLNVTCDHRRADLDLALDILLRARAATALPMAA